MRPLIGEEEPPHLGVIVTDVGSSNITYLTWRNPGKEHPGRTLAAEHERRLAVAHDPGSARRPARPRGLLGEAGVARAGGLSGSRAGDVHPWPEADYGAERELCETCEVRPECLKAALADESLLALWGGTTEASGRRCGGRWRSSSILELLLRPAVSGP
jgi:hypothetical protein